MDDTCLTELELISRFIKSVKDKKSEIIKLKLLGTDAQGLSKIIISASDVPCLPRWPKPRMFACPGVKSVKWCPTPSPPHYFIVGDPDAVILVIQQRLLRKASKMLKNILLQFHQHAQTLDWKFAYTRRRPNTSPESPLSLGLSSQHEFVEPQPPCPDVTRRTTAHLSSLLPPTPNMQDLLDTAAELKQQSSGQKDDNEMPLLLRQDTTPLSDYWNWCQ
jgi:hypothetical protein